MGLIGHWRRSVLGAGGVALLLPLGLALGVALTAALGGGTTIRALGQVFAGPSVPTRDSAPGLEVPGSVPAVPVRRRSVAPAAAGAQGPHGSTPAGGRPSGPASGPGTPQPAGPDPSTTAPGGGASPTTPGPGPAPAPAPASAAHDAVQRTVDAVPALPTPVGAAAADAMQTVVDLIP